MLPATAIVLLLSLGGGTWLDVPFIRQPKNDCGPASLWMVMQYWKTATPPIGEIHRSTFSSEAAGVYAADMSRYLDEHGFHTWTFEGTWQDLREHVLQGQPLIVALRGAPLHYVVVAGIDAAQDIVLLNDAASTKLRAMHRSDFERRWRATQNWTLLALPAGSTPQGDTRKSEIAAASASEPSAAAHPALEAASASFRQGDYARSKTYAERAEQTDPLDSTTNDLLATLYLLDGNVEAALKHWNRIGQPAIRNVGIDPALAIDPVLLDHAFAFSSGSVMTVPDLLLTQRRLDTTRSLSTYRFDFVPVDDNRFDVTLHAADATGPHYLSWLRGLPYQTVQPHMTDMGRRTLNGNSLLRWDPMKRRAMVSADGTFDGHDSMRFLASADARDELWDFRGSEFRLRRVDGSLSLQSILSSRATWTSGLTAGTARIGYRSSAEVDLVRWPEKRLIVSAGGRIEIARDHSLLFMKEEPSMHVHWLPKARGEDYETTVQLRAGHAGSRTPVDELFILGLDRDSDLQLRAHSSMTDGRKGAGPMGTHYVLLNAQTVKTVRDFGIARLSAGPFVDVARMSEVFVDAGFLLNLSVARSLTISFSLGRDLRSGHTMGFLN